MPLASADEVATLIKVEQLHGCGIGYVDAHLLASIRLAPDTHLGTRDKRLHRVAERLSVAALIDHG